MSRQGAPTRTRQRMPSMSWRRVNREGRPCRFRAGKQWFEPGPLGIGQIGSWVTAFTRSPVLRWILVDQPVTGDLATSKTR